MSEPVTPANACGVGLRTSEAPFAAADGYAAALEALAQMSRDEGMLSVQAGLAKDPMARLTHKQNEVALAYAHLRLKRHTEKGQR